MQKKYLVTQSKARLQLVRSNLDKDYNWLFLPGGPGLGSESLTSLTEILDLPGSTWHLDLPDDGSNITSSDGRDFSHWSTALVEAVDKFKNVILVAHSTGGMYTLATPELKNKLSGLVLMNSAPDSCWQSEFADYSRTNPLRDIENLHKKYTENPSDTLLKKLTLASLPYCFEKLNNKQVAFFRTLPYNFKSCKWSAENFDQTYKAQWFPNNMPTLILSGEKDHVTPLHFFSDRTEFNASNIILRNIKSTGHFPWLENPDEIIRVFNEYCETFFNRR